MGKVHPKRKTFHQCALFSLFWSFFYSIRVVIYVVSYKNKSVDEAVEWQILQALISLMGICVSLSLFNFYRKDGSVFLIVSWVTWMFANFTLSLILLHMSIFELLSTTETDFVRFMNDSIDLVHIFNAPCSIYFILVCVAHSLSRSDESNEVLFDKKNTRDGYEQLKYEVLHLHEGLDEDEIVYYV